MAGSALKKFLRGHLAHCKMWEFSLQEERHCTCGRDRADMELKSIIRLLGFMEELGEDAHAEACCPVCLHDPHTTDCELGGILKGLRDGNTLKQAD